MNAEEDCLRLCHQFSYSNFLSYIKVPVLVLGMYSSKNGGLEKDLDERAVIVSGKLIYASQLAPSGKGTRPNPFLLNLQIESGLRYISW